MKKSHTVLVNKVELPFNVANYMEAYKLRKVRLYLQTKNIFSVEDEEDDDLPAYIQDNEKTEAQENQVGTSSLIGSSEERNKIAEEQRNEYSLSLNADIAKEEGGNTRKEFKLQERRVNTEPLDDYVTDTPGSCITDI